MAAIIPTFEYDIFISYRHNDNRSGWVTEFVNALQEELAATIKEPLTIYFDKNPHDGLLETHNVDKSLEGKLKCLIFIPIISQTYCDTKSFAWQHEFVAFNKLCQEGTGAEEFPLRGSGGVGRDIKLSNGNVASRILPIKIHDLDAEDKSLIEKEIGGVLRAIEFIYKEAGVNRPLKSTDSKTDNQNKSDYRNQVNKVANAIKELIGTLKPSEKTLSKKIEENIVHPTQRTRRLGAIIAFIVLILALAAYFIYPKIKLDASSSTIDKSIAVLPFVNMSNDPEQEYFSDGMTDEVLNRLFKIGDLKVISRTSSMKFKGAKLTTKEIADQLGVTNILEGSVQKAGNRVKITAQLIDAKTDNHLWSESYEREIDDVFAIQSEIAQGIARELQVKLSASLKSKLNEIPTQNKLAYEYFLKARQEYERYWTQAGQWSVAYNAIALYSKAIEEDSLFAEARYFRVWTSLETYFHRRGEKKALDDLLALTNKDIHFLKENAPESPEYKRALAWHYYKVDRNYKRALGIFGEVLSENPNDLEAATNFAYVQRRMGLWNESIKRQEKCLQVDPLNDITRGVLIESYNLTHQSEKALELIKLGLSNAPNANGLKLDMTWFLIEMGYGLKAALKEAEVTYDEWVQYWGSDLLNPGNTSILDKLKIKGQLVGVRLLIAYSNAYHWNGDLKLSKVYADSAITLLLRKQKEQDYMTNPDDAANLYRDLGISYALAGNEKLALLNAENAINTIPVSLDAFNSIWYEEIPFRIYIHFKKYDLALDKLEVLLSKPSLLSIGWMMVDPVFEPLRNMPRFKKLAEKYKYVKKG